MIRKFIQFLFGKKKNKINDDGVKGYHESIAEVFSTKNKSIKNEINKTLLTEEIDIVEKTIETPKMSAKPKRKPKKKNTDEN
jgi:hypothetical protein